MCFKINHLKKNSFIHFLKNSEFRLTRFWEDSDDISPTQFNGRGIVCIKPPIANLHMAGQL